MIGELSSTGIDEVLRSEILGRIGCMANGWPYIVPVTYMYSGVTPFTRTAPKA
jgi:nitroimidazol reductase NimA-like FMN-containing flavoprotein (pyridoxamine 5'-phosphate oxidase superfamily)